MTNAVWIRPFFESVRSQWSPISVRTPSGIRSQVTSAFNVPTYFKCLTWDGVAIHVINQINEAKDGNRYPSLLHFSWCFIHCQSWTVKDNIILSWGHFFIWATAYYMTLHSSAALPSCSKWKLVCCCSARLCFGENYSHFIVPYKEDVYLPFVLSYSYTQRNLNIEQFEFDIFQT